MHQLYTRQFIDYRFVIFIIAQRLTSSLVSPKREAGAGVGVRLLMGFPQMKIRNFQSFKVPNFQKFHFMFLNKYWSLIHDSRDFVIRISKFVSVAAFSIVFFCSISEISRSPKMVLSQSDWVFLFRLKYLGVSEVEHNRFWDSWSRLPGPRSIKMMGLRVFPKSHRKVPSRKWSRIILWSFRAILLIKFTRKITSQAPPEPKSRAFPYFPGFRLPSRRLVASQVRAYQWRAFLGAKDLIWSCKAMKFLWQICENPYKIWIWGLGGLGCHFYCKYEEKIKPKAPLN